MKSGKKVSKQEQTEVAPALTPEGREARMIGYAIDLEEQRLRNGTATAAEIIHYLKLGSVREKLEREKLVKENIMLDAKTEAIKSGKVVEELYANAIEAMRRYSAHGLSDE